MSTGTIRDIIKQRDECEDEIVDDLFCEAQDLLDEGVDPEEVLMDVFGLEPDYFWDIEFQRALMGEF